jgi:hypothetical protein
MRLKMQIRYKKGKRYQSDLTTGTLVCNGRKGDGAGLVGA